MLSAQADSPPGDKTGNHIMNERQPARWITLTALAALAISVTPLSGWGQWSSEVNVSNTAGIFSGGGRPVLDTSGNIHLGFYDFLDAYRVLFYTTNASGSWQKTQVASPAWGASIVITPDDVIHLFRGDGGMYEYTKPLVGGAWSGPTRVDISPAQGGYLTDVEVDSSGGILFLWLRLFGDSPNRNAVWARYKPLGGSWGPLELVISDEAEHTFPDGHGVYAHNTDFYVSYTWQGNSYYRVRRAGGSWDPPVLLVPDGGGIRFAWSPVTDEMAASWSRNRGNCDLDYTTYAMTSMDQGATWGPIFTISDGCWLFGPQAVHFDANGNLHIGIEGKYNNASQNRAYYRARINGTWGPVVDLSQQNLRTGMPHKGLTSHNNLLHVVYNRTLNGFEEIFHRSNPQGDIGGRGTITGYVRDQYGVGIRNAFVAASGNYVTQVHSDGSYTLSLPPRLYNNITAYKDYFGSSVASNITVTTGSSQQIDFNLIGQAPAAVQNFKVNTGNRENELYWVTPTSGNFSGIVVRYKTTGYPTGPTDGTLFVDQYFTPGSITRLDHTNLTNGVTYYYAAYAYFADVSRYYAPVQWAAGAPAGPADMDHDGDVDQDDFGMFQACQTGLAVPQDDDDCQDAKLDGDEDVDEFDLDIWLGCVSGAQIASDPFCDQ